MQYRPLGRTGLQVSEIGMGCEGLAAREGAQLLPLLDSAMQSGVNYIDLYSPDPILRSNLGRALRGRRDRFILQGHLCAIWKDEQYLRTRNVEEVRTGFVDLLNRLETPFIEVGMIHYVDAMADWHSILHGPIMAYAKELKRAGLIGHIGLSSHNPEVAVAAVESGCIEVLLFSINPCYDLQPAEEDIETLWAEKSYAGQLVNMNPQREALYELCSRRGVGITVMKAFGGGDLLSETLSPAGKALTVCQCIHYALTRPAVATVLSGAHTVEELEAGLAYETATAAQRDYAAAFAAFPKISWRGHCMYCGHCAPCPQGIDVAAVTKFYNLARAQGGIPETVREHYGVLPVTAGACVGCGACQTRCPFQVDVVANMESAALLFGK